MDERDLRKELAHLPMGGIRYYDQVTSTNDVTLAWATEGAADLSLVVADEQTAGRGRAGRQWYTPAGAALAFSLIMRPAAAERHVIPIFTALGALAVAQALEKYKFQPEIKWPNDILLNRRKVCGVLAEAVWVGSEVESVVLGIGLNVRAQAVPPPDVLDFPATSLEETAGRAFERESLLADILAALLEWRPRLGMDEFIRAWQEHLAFRGEMVRVWVKNEPERTGQVLGLDNDGSLRLRSPQGEIFSVYFGDVRLRLVV